MINHDSDLTTNELINPVEIDTVEDGDCVLSTLGATQPRKTILARWVLGKRSQQKTELNPRSLFDIFDPEHVSFSDIQNIQ